MDVFVKNSMTFTRWLQIKQVIKLCNNSTSPKRGEDGYDPAYKYDMIFKTIIDNLNVLTERAELDQCADETSFAFGGYGEPGLFGSVYGKPNCNRGGQTVLMSDVNRCRPRTYVHRHNLHPRPTGFNQGPNEVRLILESIKPLVSGRANPDGRRQIFTAHPHCTWDNFFSGNKIMDYAGQNGFGMTSTCRRDRLPKGVPEMYWQKKKTDSSKRCKAARFNHPITAVKTVPATATTKAYQKVHVTFQSTSSCNISCTNALNDCHLRIAQRDRGRGPRKRRWGIEMNDARSLYLHTYYRIDCLDHMIENTKMFYRSWKYWHSPMNHAKSMAVVVAYNMYLECAEGELDAGWKLETPMDFWTFRENLSKLMLQYDPINRCYPGDNQMRASTKQTSTQRQATVARACGRPRTPSPNPDRRNNRPRLGQGAGLLSVPTMQMFLDVSEGNDSRLCGDLDKLMHHAQSVKGFPKRGRVCAVCGAESYTSCEICGEAMYYHPRRSQAAGRTCFYEYHNDTFFGLARKDCAMVGDIQADWAAPTRGEKMQRKSWIGFLKETQKINNAATTPQQSGDTEQVAHL